MNIFKYAVINKMRVQTSRGALSAEQLLDLPINPDLRNVVVNLAKKLDQETPTTLDFLDESIEVDELTQAQFDLVKEIIKHKQSEIKTKTTEAATRTHNAKIDALIAKKKEQELENMSLEDLIKLKK